MTSIDNKKWIRPAVAILALATIPLTVLATSFTTITVSSKGEFGSAHYITGARSVAIGTNNYVEASDALASGKGLRIDYTEPYSTVVGKYNTSTSGQAFVVGNGTGSATAARANAFEVFFDGRVLISIPQGDISMGIYGD